MARYFIDTDEGGLMFHDADGLEHADVQGARDMALATLPEMAKHGLRSGSLGPFQACVRDEGGSTLYSASLRLEEEWTIVPAPTASAGGGEGRAIRLWAPAVRDAGISD